MAFGRRWGFARSGRLSRAAVLSWARRELARRSHPSRTPCFASVTPTRTVLSPSQISRSRSLPPPVGELDFLLELIIPRLQRKLRRRRGRSKKVHWLCRAATARVSARANASVGRVHPAPPSSSLGRHGRARQSQRRGQPAPGHEVQRTYEDNSSSERAASCPVRAVRSEHLS